MSGCKTLTNNGGRHIKSLLTLIAAVVITITVIKTPAKPFDNSVSIHKQLSSAEVIKPPKSFVGLVQPIEVTKQPLKELKAQQATVLEAVATETVAAPEPVQTDIQGLAQQKAAERGWVGNDWTALNQLIHNESGWNAYAINSSSGACGLFQALPCSKYGAPLSNISNQIDWGLSYIGATYGSPSNALASWLSRYPHWY